MTVAAAVCIGIALLAELTGIGLVIRNGVAASRALREWRRPTAASDADQLQAVFRRRNTQLAHLQLVVPSTEASGVMRRAVRER